MPEICQILRYRLQNLSYLNGNTETMTSDQPRMQTWTKVTLLKCYVIVL